MIIEPIQHLEWIDAQLKHSGLAQQAAFGALCLERQWALLARACEEHAQLSGLPAKLKRELDLAWQAVERGTHATRASNRSLADELSCQSESETLVFYITNGLLDFVDALSEGDPGYASYAASTPIASIEMLAESVDQPREVQLLSREIGQQRIDWDKVRTADLESLEVLKSLRDEANGYDLFDGEWFY